MSGDNCAPVSGTALLLIPTITVPLTVDGVSGMGNELVETSGLTEPRPVTKAVSVSPRRAGLVGLANVPSGRSITARTTPSDWVVWKMPGLAGNTFRLRVWLPPSTVTVTGCVPGVTSQGTRNTICCWPTTFDTEKIGAQIADEPVPKLTVSVATSYDSGPTTGGKPDPPKATPVPTIAAMPQGEIKPIWPSAPFTKLETARF